MLATLLCALLVSAACLLIGQSVLTITGMRQWSWISAPVGFAVLMLLTVPAIHVPGRAATTAGVVLVACLCGAVAMFRLPATRPPWTDLAAGIPLAALVAVPFVSAGDGGILGMSFNNDWYFHLTQAEAYMDASVLSTIEIAPQYPLGPHAAAASIGKGLGVDMDLALAGVTAALPLLLGLSALAALSPGTSWPGRAATAMLVGGSYLVVAYFGQGSFKEIGQALFVLGMALELRRARGSGRMRWVPFALIVCGILSVYSFFGLAWPVAVGGAWLLGLALVTRVRGELSLGTASHALRREAPSLAIAAGVALLLLVPQLPRLARYFGQSAGSTGIDESNLGNLVGPIPFWEALGMWDAPDYRLPPPDPLLAGAWSAFALALVVAGAVWWLRRGDWIVLTSAVACFAIWAVSEASQSAYVTAKALVILAPFLLLIAIRPLVELSRTARAPGWLVVAAPLAAAVLVAKTVGSSWESLRFIPVGPRDHAQELRALRPMLGDEPTLFLGNSDFLQWELAGVPVRAPVVGLAQLVIRPEKQWQYSQPHDIDSIDAATLNTFRWIITTRDPAASAMPAELRPVRTTASFQLWERRGEVRPRGTLVEGPNAAAALDCASAEGRAIRRTDARALIRQAPVAVAAPVVAAGDEATVTMTLGPGRWMLAMPYSGRVDMDVTAQGATTTLAAGLDRPGPRFTAGTVELDRREDVEIRLRAHDTVFASPHAAAVPGQILAVPDTSRLVPIGRACGRLVDWYEPAG